MHIVTVVAKNWRLSIYGGDRIHLVPRFSKVVGGASDGFRKVVYALHCTVARCSSSSSSSSSSGIARARRLDGGRHGGRPDAFHLVVVGVVPGDARVGADHVLELDDTTQVDGTAVTERRHVRSLHCRQTHTHTHTHPYRSSRPYVTTVLELYSLSLVS